jgi:hypothetical protein
MLRELKQMWDSLPWYAKLLIIVLFLNYTRGRKGIIWRLIKIPFIIYFAALLAPFCFLIYCIGYVYYFVPREYIAIFFFSLLVQLEILLFILARKKKKQSGGKRPLIKDSHSLFLNGEKIHREV